MSQKRAQVSESFHPNFWVSMMTHPDAMERVIRSPNKVPPATLQAILHLGYLFQLGKRMAGTEIKPQSQRSQKWSEVPEAVFHLYHFYGLKEMAIRLRVKIVIVVPGRGEVVCGVIVSANLDWEDKTG